MRKRQTFLLTILTPEYGTASFCGQIKVIATGKVTNFTSTDELYRLIASEMGEDGSQPVLQSALSPNQAEKEN